MARRKKTEEQTAQKTPRQLEIEELRSMGRDGRDNEQSARLSFLMGEERRDRFIRLLPKRLERMRSAFRGLRNMANVNSYQYTEDEAVAICNAVANAAAELKRMYTGAPKEKGMYDL